jgi:DNA-binding transcriptional regulator YiaG
MGKMEQTIKSEVIRLAKKEIRAICLPLAHDVRHLKRIISELRKTVAPLKVLGSELQAQKAAELLKLQATPEEVGAARLSPLLIKKLRKRLGISQGDMAVLVGVSAGAVASWEYGLAKPKGRNREALVALRKLGKREVKKLLADKKVERRPKTTKRKRARRKRR